MRILITGAWRDVLGYAKEIREMGNELMFLQREEEALPCEADWPQAIVCNGFFRYHPLELFGSLRYLQLTSAGLDRIPLETVRQREILMCHAGGIYSIPMAEAALNGVLQLYRKTGYFYENQRRHIWNKKRDLTELYGKRVCVLGCGHAGKACAKVFRGMGCQVTGIRMRKQGSELSELFDAVYAVEAMDALLKDTDILILTVSLTVGTRHIIGAKQLQEMKQGAVLVNISRGGLVDQTALEKALENGLGGAVLDVFEEEPLDKNSKFWDMKQVIVTPHSSFISDGSRQRLNRMILDNLSLWSRLEAKGYR